MIRCSNSLFRKGGIESVRSTKRKSGTKSRLLEIRQEPNILVCFARFGTGSWSDCASINCSNAQKQYASVSRHNKSSVASMSPLVWRAPATLCTQVVGHPRSRPRAGRSRAQALLHACACGSEVTVTSISHPSFVSHRGLFHTNQRPLSVIH